MQICRSYPKFLVVPQDFDDSELIEYVAPFRNRSRFPVLTYYHKQSQVSQ